MMDNNLEHDEKRDATPSMRGYVYQAYQSVIAWMNLKEKDVLYLEAAEDFDVHEVGAVLVTQVKDTAGSGSITLRSNDVVNSINNYWNHKGHNPDRIIRFRFLTTAIPGQEKGISFGEVGKGILYWMLAARDDQVALKPIKDFLLELPINESLKEFLQKCSDKSLRNDLVSNIQWDTGQKPKDGLIAVIEEQLIIHGDRKGIDSYNSRKALDTLVRKVADLLSTAGDKRLTYADFCLTFDETTMETMPKGEAVALRSIVSSLYSSVKTSELKSLTQNPHIFDSPLPLVRGAAPRNHIVEKFAAILRHNEAIFLHGSTGLGKTSLARLITDHLGGEWAWAGFRGFAPIQIADLLRRATWEIKVLGLSPQIVLDDVDLGGVATFEKELLALFFSVVNTGGFIVMTGPAACPPNLLAKLWRTAECAQEVPYLDVKDVAVIAVNHGLVDRDSISKWVNVILLTTQGHPQLVHARIRNLQKKNWPPVEDMTWITGEDLENERIASRSRLLNEIPSKEARLLAFRLSLMVEFFSRKIAIALAQLPPQISLAGETFDLLVGPWIEKVGDNKYRVSPLLLNQGKEVLTLAETIAVHETIALDMLGRSSLSPNDVGTVLSHGLAAKSENVLISLARGIMLLENEAYKALGDAIFWFSSFALMPGQHIFKQNHFIDLSLRLVQYRIAASSKQADNAHAIIERTCELLEQEENQELVQANRVMAYSIFLNTIEISIPPCKTIPMLSWLIDFSQTNSSFGEIVRDFIEKPDTRFDGLSPIQSLFTFEVARVHSLDALQELLAALDKLAPEKRTYLLITIEGHDSFNAELLIGSAWLGEASKDQFNVDKSISTLQFVVKVGRSWQTLKLVCAAYVGMSVIYDEYGKSQDNALLVLDEAEKILGNNNARLLNQRAKVLFGLSNYGDALTLFVRALNSGDLSNVEQRFSARLAGIAAARLGDWSKAEQLFSLGANVVVKTNDMKRMAIGLSADAAFALWKQGKKKESLKLYKEVLENLNSVPIDDNIKNRHLHAMIGHSLLWINNIDNIVKMNIPEPPPGACSNQEPHEGFKNLEIKGMPTIWALLASIDIKFGYALGIAETTKEKYADKLPLLMKNELRCSNYQALFANVNVDSAVPALIAMYEGLECLKLMQIGEMDVWSDKNIPPLPPEYLSLPQNKLNLLYRLLSVAIAATISNHDNAPLPLESWQIDLQEKGINGPEVDLFFDLLKGKVKVSDDDILHTACNALYRLRSETVYPKDLFVIHFRMLNFLTGGDWGIYLSNSFAEHVSRQWQNVTDNQKFHLISPIFYVPLLNEKCGNTTLHGYAKAAAILETAAAAAGVKVAKSGYEFLLRLIGENKS